MKQLLEEERQRRSATSSKGGGGTHQGPTLSNQLFGRLMDSLTRIVMASEDNPREWEHGGGGALRSENERYKNKK